MSYSSQTTSLFVQYKDNNDLSPCNRAILCQDYNATYSLEVDVANHVPSLNASIISYHDQLQVPAPTTLPSYPFVAIQQSLYAYLTGDVSINSSFLDTTQLSATNLLANTTTYTMPDISTKLPELMTNLTVSALLRSNITSEVTCTISVLENVYSYNQIVLILAYGSAVILSLVGLFVGIRATYVNGGPTGGIFSQLLVTVSLFLTPHQ
jgi:hypothetical protein